MDILLVTCACLTAAILVASLLSYIRRGTKTEGTVTPIESEVELSSVLETKTDSCGVRQRINKGSIMASTTTEISNTDDNISCEINDQQPRDDNSNICKSDPDVENVDNFQTPEESKSDQSSDKPGLHESRDSNDQSTEEAKHQSDACTDEETKSVHNGLDSSSGDNNNDDKDSVVPDEDTVDVFHSVSSDVVCSADSDKNKHVESSPTEHSTSESGISDEGLGTSQENMDMDKNSTESDTDSDNNGDEISPQTDNIVETVAETNSCVTASNEDENINSGSDEQPYINSNDIACIEDQNDNCSSDHVLSSPEDTTSSHETTESHHKRETPVQYEVEYTGTINLEQGCVENLDMVQKEDREVYADEKLATNELDSDNEVATKTESVENVEVSCVIDTVKETEEVLHTEERNEVTCETNEQVGDLRHDCNVEKSVTNSIQSTDELDTSVIKDNVEECDVKTCNDHLNSSDNKPEVDNITSQSHIDTHPISDQGKDKAVKHEVQISTEEKRKSVESTDSKEKSAESDSDPLESTWRTCLLCFRDKMATIGLQSASLDTFVTSSSLTLRTMCTNHKTFRLKRQNTDPGDSRNGSEKRAIKIVKMSSFDTSLDPDSHAESDTKDNSTMDTMIIKESFQETDFGDEAGSKSDSDNEAVSDTEATPGVETTEDYTDNKVTTEDKNTEDDSVPISENDASESKAEPNVVNIVSEHKNSESVCEQISGIDDVVPKTETVVADDKAEDTATESNAELTTESATTLAILRDLGEKLNFEYEQRKRAEDWADFLSLELDAHIDARTSAEERFTAMRERTIRVVGKYRKLKSDHAALLSQLNDIALADAPPDQQAAPRSSLLRRNRSQGDRGAILAKRNAMLIRGSRRQRSSGDSESSDEKQADDAETYNGVPRNLDDVKRKWEVDFKKKQQIEPKKLVASSSQDVSTSSVHDTSLSSTLNRSVDFSELSETTDHVKFSREMVAYDNYVTSTPIKTAESVDQLHALKQKSGDSVSKRVDFDKDKSKSTPDVRNEDDKDNKVIVNVKAFRNMWEQKIQKIPFQTMTNAQHEKEEQAANQETASSASPKRMRIRNVEDLKKRMEETAKATEIERRLDKNDNVQISSDSEDDEFFDVDSPGEDFLSSSGEVLTESLSPKQALHMWQNLSGSNNSSSNANELSKSASSHSQSQPKITLEAKASLEAQSVQPEASSLLDVPEIRLERSNRFSSLKSQWEQKGNKLPSENS